MLRKSKTDKRHKGTAFKGILYTKPRFSHKYSKKELVMKMSLISQNSSDISNKSLTTKNKFKRLDSSKNSIKEVNDNSKLTSRRHIESKSRIETEALLLTAENDRSKGRNSRRKINTKKVKKNKENKEEKYPRLKKLASQRSKSTQASNSNRGKTGFLSSQPKFPEEKICHPKVDYEKFMQNLHRMIPDPGQYEVSKKITWKKPSLSRRGVYGLANRDQRFKKQMTRIETPGPGKYGYGEIGQNGQKVNFGDEKKTMDFSKKLGRDGEVHGFGNDIGAGIIDDNNENPYDPDTTQNRVKSAMVRRREIKSKSKSKKKVNFL